MGNCCPRKHTSSNGQRKTVGVTGRFSYIDDVTIKHVDDNGEYACIDDRNTVGSKPQNSVCSAEDVRAFFAVEPNETYDDECEGQANHVTACVGNTVNTFRLHADEPEDSGCKLSNSTTSKTTTVLVKLNAYHRTTPVGCANDAFSSEDQNESEMNSEGVTKTSLFTFTTDSGLTIKKSPSLKNACISRRAETYKCDPEKTSLVTSHNNDGEQLQKVVSSTSNIMEMNRCEQKSSHEPHALLSNEHPYNFPRIAMEKSRGGNHENNQMEGDIILCNSRSRMETNKDGIKVKTESPSPSISSHEEEDVSIVGLEQIGIACREQSGDDTCIFVRKHDCDRDLYPMYDSDFPSSDYDEADRDLNEIWTVSEFVPFFLSFLNCFYLFH